MFTKVWVDHDEDELGAINPTFFSSLYGQPKIGDGDIDSNSSSY